VAGICDQGKGNGVYGCSTLANGIYGEAKAQFNSGVVGVHKGDTGWGVYGDAVKGTGVFGKSGTWHGVSGETASLSGGAGVHGKGPLAGLFEGDVFISKTLTVKTDIVLENADCAEDFDISSLGAVEPGTVMVIDSEGALKESDRGYDKRVAGVISGAGSYRPAMVLDKQHTSKHRLPVALMGKVYCKVDASYGAIEVGDLLTTSPTRGHAMRASDPATAFGAVIGKALKGLDLDWCQYWYRYNDAVSMCSPI
jgi:hypothetical protein